MSKYNATNIMQLLHPIDPQKCDDDNKSDSNSNIERSVCDSSTCSKLKYFKKNKIKAQPLLDHFLF